jgi:hypothetical protein
MIYTWTIVQMRRLTSDGYVIEVDYTTTANDAGYTASTAGKVTYVQQPGEPFTPYDQLTEAQVIGWVQAAVGTGVEQVLSQNIENQKPTATGLPWA